MRRFPYIAQKLADGAAGLSLETVPAPVVDSAKRCIVDVVGVALAGSLSKSAHLTRAQAVETYASGPCDLLGSDDRLSAAGATFVNAVAAHALDFDDNCYAGIVHGSAVVFPAVFAAAQWRNASGAELLAGFIAGLEVEFALGKALTHQFYEKGWWTTSALGAIGAASGAARVAGLNAQATERAIALAAVGTGGIRALRGTDAKPYHCGRAAESGVTAAQLAARGASAPTDVFEDKNGFLKVLNDSNLDIAPIDRFGTSHGLRDPGVDIKRFPVCYAGHAAAEATGDLLKANGLTFEKVERIVVQVPPLVASNLTYPRPRSGIEAQFSLEFAVAAVAVFGEISLDHLAENVICDPQLQAMLEKVEMQVVETVDALSEVKPVGPEWANVQITTTTGATLVGFNGTAIGSAARPLSKSDLDTKFLNCATRAIDARKAEAWLSALYRIEALEGVRNIV